MSTPIYLSDIIQTIEVLGSGKKGKLGFLNSNNQECSTEEAFKDYMEQKGWKVMRAEVSFWQAMFCLSFWEEIFINMGNPCKDEGGDIPRDLFRDNAFYLNRQTVIDQKADYILQQSLPRYINGQIQKYKGYWTRLLYNGPWNLVEYCETDIVQAFLHEIDVHIFQKIVYRIARNPNQNRSGVSDFVIWNTSELKIVEVKKIKEQVRYSQSTWIDWMLSENVPVAIVRVKSI